MLVRQPFPLPLRVLPGGGDGIPDLPSIHPLLLKILQMIAQVRDIDLVVIPKRLEPVQEILPDPEALIRTQDRVVQRELNAGFEGFVVFEHAQEHRPRPGRSAACLRGCAVGERRRLRQGGPQRPRSSQDAGPIRDISPRPRL